MLYLNLMSNKCTDTNLDLARQLYPFSSMWLQILNSDSLGPLALGIQHINACGLLESRVRSFCVWLVFGSFLLVASLYLSIGQFFYSPSSPVIAVTFLLFSTSKENFNDRHYCGHWNFLKRSLFILISKFWPTLYMG